MVELQAFLLLEKPTAFMFVVDAFWPLAEVKLWRAREEALDRLANEFKHIPQPMGPHTVMWAMDRAGRMYVYLLEEMILRT